MFSPRKMRNSQQLMFQDSPRTSQKLTASNYSNKILGGLNSLRSQELLCDYSLVTDNLTMRVHRSVMVACSDYFHAMLTGDMREAKETSVHLHGVTSHGLQAMVNFAYTGVLDINLDNLEDVLSASTHLQMAEAVELCCQFIDTAVTIDNCVDILNLTELYSLKAAKKRARGFILKNFEALSNTDQYQKLNSGQLSSLLEENSLKIVSEYALFELVLKWIQHDKENHSAHLAELMSKLRLPLLSGEELVDKVSRVDLIKENKACIDLLMEAKDYHIVTSKQPLMQTSRTQIRSHKLKIVMCHADNLEIYDLENKRHAFLRDAPVASYNSCVCVVDNFMYACGGKYDSNENNEIATARCFRYDPRFDSWFELTSMNEARKDFVMVTNDNRLFAIGGQDENMVTCSVEVYSIEKDEWEVRATLGNAVYAHAGVLCGNTIYISGGQRFDGCCSAVLCYDTTKNDKWVERASLSRTRSNHMMCCVNERIYVLGGNVEDNYGFPVPTTGIEVYNPNADQWTWLQGSCNINIREAGACVIGSKIYIIGGINGEHYYTDTVQCYETKTNTVEVVERFITRIYGRACCLLTLPQYI